MDSAGAPMSSNIREFTLGLEAFAKKNVPEAVGNFRDAIALEALRGVVLLTPVDTGRLRGNWQTTIGTPADGEIEATDKSGGPTIAKGAAVIAGAKKRPFEPVWLHDGLEYAVFVNDGTPKVPAVHMVEQTVNRLESRFGKFG
jgi:hypothetical protein